MVHPQPQTPIQVENSTTVGFFNKTIKKPQNPLTCVFIGSKTEKHKNNSNYTGYPVKETFKIKEGTLVVIMPNISPKLTTLYSDQ